VAYRGLTLSNPTLVVTLPNDAERWPVPLAGHVSVVSGEHVWLSFIAPGVSAWTMAGDESGDYRFEFRWPPDKQSASGTVIAVRVVWTFPEPDVRVPEYKTIATRNAMITPESTTIIDFAPADFEPIRNLPIRGHVVHPENFRLQSISVYWESANELLPLHTVSSSMRPLGDDFEFLVPLVESATYQVTVSAFAPGQSGPEGGVSGHNASVGGLRLPVEDVEVVLFPGPELLEPQETAAGVDSSTRFAWTASPGPGIYELTVESWNLQGPAFGGRYRYSVYLSDTTATVEDLPAVGVGALPDETGLIPGEQYLWTVYKLHSMFGLDEAASRSMLGKYSWASASRWILFKVRQRRRLRGPRRAGLCRARWGGRSAL
jgi:hypothetical protein